jgi:hypothetical protein
VYKIIKLIIIEMYVCIIRVDVEFSLFIVLCCIKDIFFVNASIFILSSIVSLLNDFSTLHYTTLLLPTAY